MTHRTHPTLTALHGSDGKWHLYDAVARKAFDAPPCATKAEALAEIAEYERDMAQLAQDEGSENMMFGE